jgi:hypothetical protein
MQPDAADHSRPTPSDAAALGQAAFKLVAARRYDAARPLLERARALEPRNGTLAHVMAHLTTDSGAWDEGAAFLRAFLAGADPEDGFHAHNSWHLASLELDLGRPAAALARYEDGVAPRVPQRPIMFFGAAALLWRLELYGFGAARRARGAGLPWGGVRAAALSLGDAADPVALNDTARAMAFIAAEDGANLAALLERRRVADPARRPAGADIVEPLVLGLHEFWRGDYPTAIDRIAPLVAGLTRLGGTPDQHAVFDDTLIEAQLRAGRFADAETRLRRRLATGQAPRDRYWLGRAQQGSGQAAARDSLTAARRGWHAAEPDAPELVALDRLRAA